MREIKFRVWDKEEKRMSYPFGIGEQIIAWRDDDVDMPVVFAYVKDNRFEFIQFTGLLDRDGVEIYEGDIVVIGEASGDKVPAIVKFGEGTITACGYDDHNDYNYWGWYLDGLIGCDEELKIGNDIKVIGNIYENPELAEVKK